MRKFYGEAGVFLNTHFRALFYARYKQRRCMRHYRPEHWFVNLILHKYSRVYLLSSEYIFGACFVGSSCAGLLGWTEQHTVMSNGTTEGMGRQLSYILNCSVCLPNSYVTKTSLMLTHSMLFARSTAQPSTVFFTRCFRSV